MTVGDLKSIIADLPDDMAVALMRDDGNLVYCVTGDVMTGYNEDDEDIDGPLAYVIWGN